VTQDDYYQVRNTTPTPPKQANSPSLTTASPSQGYFIPKNSGILNNVYTVCSDPTRYPDPRRFSPERYASNLLSFADTATHADPATRDLFTFGAGRRICQGMHVAERSMFIAISRLLWAFDFAAVPGNVPDPAAISEGLACMPAKFACEITAREGKAGVIRGVWDEARTTQLDGEGQWRDLLSGTTG
jgi:cytochrome P450